MVGSTQAGDPSGVLPFLGRETGAPRERPAHFECDSEGVSGTASDPLALYAELS